MIITTENTAQYYELNIISFQYLNIFIIDCVVSIKAIS